MKPPHLLFALFFIACLTASPLPSFDYNSLDDSASFLLTSLLNHGGIVINNIPGFVEARNKMIESPLSFDASDVGSSLDFDETTGLTRLTISSMVSRGQKEEEEQQPLSSLSPLRNVVDDVVDEFLSTLSTVAPAKLAGVLYPNGAVAPLTELSRKGEGLEHYHYYTKPTGKFFFFFFLSLSLSLSLLKQFSLSYKPNHRLLSSQTNRYGTPSRCRLLHRHDCRWLLPTTTRRRRSLCLIHRYPQRRSCPCFCPSPFPHHSPRSWYV